jgi:hypothetical protein
MLEMGTSGLMSGNGKRGGFNVSTRVRPRLYNGKHIHLLVPHSLRCVQYPFSAALSDHKWRVAAYATLLTYAGLFALFLTWRLASIPFELDQERQECITGLSKSLIYTRSKLAALQAQPPAIDAEVLELDVQAETTQ